MTTLPAAARAVVLGALVLGGCADGGSGGGGTTPTPGDDPTDPQVPPRGTEALKTWLAAGYYKAWRCEPAPHPARPRGAHGANRVCNNDVLAGDGPFPVGAAAVKELYGGGGDQITGYAVSRKLEDGSTGNAWYWFEGSSGGQGVSLCVNCHGLPEAHDFVYTVVP